MSNGLTVSYPYERPALSGPVILLLAFGMLVAHILLLMLASIPPPTIQTPPQQRQLRISLAPMPAPPVEEAGDRPRAASPQPEPKERTPESAIAAPKERADEKREPEPAEPTPPEPKTAQPEPEPETAAPTRPEEPNLAPLNSVSVADDTAAGQEKPPDNPLYDGATNTEAADRSKKEKIGPDPKIDGESGEVRFGPARRGEDGNKEAARDDPLAGSIEKEGSPDPGKPPEPQTQVAQLPEPEPAVLPEPVATPEVKEPEETKTADTALPLKDVQETAAVKKPEPDGVDPLKQMTPLREEASRIERSSNPLTQRQPDRAELKDETKRPAISWAMSGATPVGLPADVASVTRSGLPKLMAARSVPLGANSERTF